MSLSFNRKVTDQCIQSEAGQYKRQSHHVYVSFWHIKGSFEFGRCEITCPPSFVSGISLLRHIIFTERNNDLPWSQLDRIDNGKVSLKACAQTAAYMAEQNESVSQSFQRTFDRHFQSKLKHRYRVVVRNLSAQNNYNGASLIVDVVS